MAKLTLQKGSWAICSFYGIWMQLDVYLLASRNRAVRIGGGALSSAINLLSNRVKSEDFTTYPGLKPGKTGYSRIILAPTWWFRWGYYRSVDRVCRCDGSRPCIDRRTGRRKVIISCFRAGFQVYSNLTFLELMRIIGFLPRHQYDPTHPAVIPIASIIVSRGVEILDQMNYNVK